ncbi:MAG: hypothetical protein FWF02_04575 [Micrococcales bacterium]|nr:hypothetical protein [Micrococcales bacterium]
MSGTTGIETCGEYEHEITVKHRSLKQWKEWACADIEHCAANRRPGDSGDGELRELKAAIETTWDDFEKVYSYNSGGLMHWLVHNLRFPEGTGDPQSLGTASETWAEIAGSVHGILGTSPSDPDWAGVAANSYRANPGEQELAIEAVAAAADTLSVGYGELAEEISGFWDFVGVSLMSLHADLEIAENFMQESYNGNRTWVRYLEHWKVDDWAGPKRGVGKALVAVREVYGDGGPHDILHHLQVRTPLIETIAENVRTSLTSGELPEKWPPVRPA